MPLTKADLTRWEQEKDIDKFVQILTYLDEDEYTKICTLAVKALVRLRDPRGLSILLKSVYEQADPVRLIAHDELIAWMKEDCDPLCKFIEDRSVKNQDKEMGLRFLTEIPCERVFQTYINLLKQGRWIHQILANVQELSDIEPITSKMLDPDPAVRYAAQLAVFHIYKNPLVTDSLIKMLDDENVQVMSNAAFILTHHILLSKENEDELSNLQPFQKAIAPSIRNLQHEDFFVRAYAADILSEIQDPAFFDLFLPMINDPYEKVRLFSVYGLSQIHNEKSYNPLAERYKIEESIKVREYIIVAIAKLPHPDSFSFLQHLVENETEKSLRIAVVEVIGLTKNEQTFSLLYKVLQEGDPEYFSAVANSLAILGDLRSAELMLDLLVKPDQKIKRSEIFAALARIKQVNAIEPLIILLGKGLLAGEVVSILRTIRRIISPQSIHEYFDQLPVSENNFFKLGLQLLKEKLD